MRMKAILSLVPGAEVVVRGDAVEWIVQQPFVPTDAEIAAEMVRLTLVCAKSDAHVAIDAQAGKTRRKYITDATGQDATYLQKAMDATAYIAAGYPSAAITSYPMVRSESRAMYGSNPTAAQYQLAADYIIATQTAFVQKGADIEEVRRGGKIAVDNAQTVADVQAAQTAAIAALVVL